MIKLIVGLGNPGSQYEKTRHNVGFLFLDLLIKGLSVSWANESKFHGLLANINIAGSKVLLLKPQTYMNKSGLSVGALAKYFKVEVDEILVVHDELDLEPGIVKLKKGGGHAGHNGLRNIIDQLGSRDFLRLRIGIGRSRLSKSVADYVLSSPSKDEQSLVESAMEMAQFQLQNIVLGQIAIAMNDINKGLSVEK